MPTLRVPYHLDEHLPDLATPLPGRADTLAVELGEGDLWARMARLHERVARRVEALARGGEAPVVASGDCMVALGTAAGLQRAGVDFSVVWFDGHGDLQTVETSTSGYMGGIPLRILLGYRPELSAARLGLRPVAEDRILLVDGRDLDPPEEEFLRGSAVRTSAVADVSADRLPEGPLLVHVDCDVLDPAEVPGLLFPTPGGPSAAELTAAVGRVRATGRVAALSLGCTWHADGESSDHEAAYRRLLGELAAA